VPEQVGFVSLIRGGDKTVAGIVTSLVSPAFTVWMAFTSSLCQQASRERMVTPDHWGAAMRDGGAAAAFGHGEEQLNVTNDSLWAPHSGKVLIKKVGRCQSPPLVDTHCSETS
jgi:hypothetical protein